MEKKIGRVDYQKKEAPRGYKCDSCGLVGIKLWREYMASADGSNFFCASCAGKAANVDISSLSKDGILMDSFWKSGEIGHYVPAIPAEDEGESAVKWWGYTSVPPGGVKWWRELPNSA